MYTVYTWRARRSQDGPVSPATRPGARSRSDGHVALLGDVVRALGARERLLVERALRRGEGAAQLVGVEPLVVVVGVDLDGDARRGGLGGAAGGPGARDGERGARGDAGVAA